MTGRNCGLTRIHWNNSEKFPVSASSATLPARGSRLSGGLGTETNRLSNLTTVQLAADLAVVTALGKRGTRTGGREVAGHCAAVKTSNTETCLANLSERLKLFKDCNLI